MNLHAHAMVYRDMWNCPQCEYRNDDWDEACAKCGADKAVQEPTLVQESSQVDDSTVITTKPEPIKQNAAEPESNNGKSRRKDPVTLLVVLLVIFMVATLGLLGYIAWQRGMLKVTEVADSNAAILNQDVAVDAEPVALDPLRELAASTDRAARPYASLAGQLLANQQEQAGLSAPAPGQNGSLSTEQQEFLIKLDAIGQGLISMYKQFEAEANQDDNADASSYQEVIAAEFAVQSERITQLIGQVYGASMDSTHDAFLLPDLFKSYYAPGRRVSLSGIDEAWAKAKEARVQRKLDLQNSEELRQLSARLEALKEVHSEFKTQLDAIPPYEVRAGNLSKAAVDALALLDSLMGVVEQLVIEQAEYVDSIQDVEPSDSMTRLMDEFDSLAQQDHFFCFSEICRISVEDQKPDQLAYDNLPQHYEFVGMYWPENSLEYLRVFEESERDWRAKWSREPGTRSQPSLN